MSDHVPVDVAACKVVERVGWLPDQMFRNERRALGRPLFRMLERAFPFKHRPAVIAIVTQLGKNLGEINLPVAQRTEAAGTISPTGIASVHPCLSIGPKLGVFHMEGLDPFVVEIDELHIIELLQHKMRRVVQDIAARMVIDRF